MHAMLLLDIAKMDLYISNSFIAEKGFFYLLKSFCFIKEKFQNEWKGKKKTIFV